MKRALLISVFAFSFKLASAQVLVDHSQQSICSGFSASINAVGAISYFWSPSNGLNTTIGNSVIANPSVSTVYTVTGFDSNGNSTQTTSEIIVNSNPILNLDIIQPSSCNYVEGLYMNPIYPDVKIMSNIVYGENYLFNGQLASLKLDIYMPSQLVNYQRPAILVLHGGGFLFGNKEDSIVVALSQFYAHRGYVVYNANYRTGMSTPNQINAGKAYYRAIQDAKSCVRYIRKTGVDIGVDTSQIFITGVSAGALTSMGTAYLDQNEIPSFINYSTLGLLDDVSGNIGYSSSVKAVVSISGGVYDTTTIFDNETEPLYSFHGTADGVIPYYSGLVGGQVLTFGGYSVNQEANQCGLNSTLHTFYGGGHVPTLTSAEMDTIFMESRDFLYAHVTNKHGENSCAMALATGGMAYAWSPSVKLSNSLSNQIIATPNFLTNYTLTTTDSNGCSAQAVVAIKSALPLYGAIKIDTVQTHMNLYAVAGGGQAPLSFLWSNGSTNGILNHVDEGTYAVTITSGDCKKYDEVQIEFPLLSKPTNLLALYINSCGAKFSWQPMPEVLYQRVRLTNLSDNSFVQQLVSATQTVFEYTDLIQGANYKFDVFNYSWNDLTSGATSYEFKTNKCEMPIQFTEYNIGETNASIQWTAACNPVSYRFKYRPVGDSVWTVTSTAIENINLYNLNTSTDYEYVARTICVSGSNYSARSDMGYFTTLGLKTEKENVTYKIQQSINVFPNPNNGTFTIQASLPENMVSTDFEILNSLGQIVYKMPLKVEDGNVYETINTRNKLVDGVYELRLKRGNDYLRSRIIIK